MSQTIRRLFIGLAGLALLFGPACNNSPPSQTACLQNTDCGIGSVCVQGFCRKEPTPPTQGKEGGPCYPDGTCNKDLACNDAKICFAEAYFVENSSEGEHQGGGDGEQHLAPGNCMGLPLVTYMAGGYQHGSPVKIGFVHAGDDVRGTAGTPVFAVWDGTVVVANYVQNGWGGLIEIEHRSPSGQYFVSLYGHLRTESIAVAIGQTVVKGTRLGVLGTRAENGGWSEHLHFAIFTGTLPANKVLKGHVSSLQGFENPIPWMNAHGVASSCSLPSLPTLIAPANNATLSPNTSTTFSWSLGDPNKDHTLSVRLLSPDELIIPAEPVGKATSINKAFSRSGNYRWAIYYNDPACPDGKCAAVSHFTVQASQTCTQTPCGADCVNTSTSQQHCGRCNNPCSSTQTCQNGQCQNTSTCQQTQCGTDCVNTSTSQQHCGRCNNPCPSSQTCQSGQCRCPSGQQDCGGSCVDTSNSKQHCGQCNLSCNGNDICQNGQCRSTCTQTQCGTDCVDTSNNAQHCGACNRACTGSQTCQNGQCICPSGQQDCNGSCVSTSNNTQHCGACNTPCSSPRSCQNGQCSCPSGQQYCAPSCVNTSTSNQHCGSCNRSCSSNQICNNGSCQSTCTPNHSKICYNNAVYWQDSCGVRGSISQSCSSDQRCSNGQCVACPYRYTYTNACTNFTSGCASGDVRNNLKLCVSSISGDSITVRVRKCDNSAFNTSATMTIRVGSYASYGVVRATKSYSSGTSEVSVTFDLLAGSISNWPLNTSKEFFATIDEGGITAYRYSPQGVSVTRQCQ